MNDKELRNKFKKYNHFELTNMCISLRKQNDVLKRDIEVIEIEKDYYIEEYNKMVAKIKNISKELILAKKELIELKEGVACQKR